MHVVCVAMVYVTMVTMYADVGCTAAGESSGRGAGQDR